jgi:translation initiation factor IF-2
MAEIRVNKVLKQFNIGLQTLIDFLASKGININSDPNAKISDEYIPAIQQQFGKDMALKEASEKVDIKLTEILEKSSKKQQEEAQIEEEEEPEQETIIKKTSFIPSDDIKKPVEQKPEGQPEMKPEVKPEAKPAVKLETEPEAKPEIQKESEPEIKVEQPAPVIEQETAPAAPEKPVETPAVAPEKPAEPEKPEIIATVEPEPTKEPVAAETPAEPVSEPAKETNPEQKISKHDKKAVQADDEEEMLKKPEKKPKFKEIITEEDKAETTIPAPTTGLKIVGKLDMSQFEPRDKHKKRERINKGTQKVDVDKLGKETDQNRKDQKSFGPKNNNNNNKGGFRPDSNSAKNGKKHGNNHNDRFRPAMTEAEQEEMQKEIQKQVKETYAKMNEGKSKNNFGAKYRKEKRELAAQKTQEEIEQAAVENKTLKVTEFVTVNDLATLMNNTPVNKVIAACMNLGLMVSINQRLDAEALVLVAEEFGYKVEFVTAGLTDEINQEAEPDDDSNLVPRPPIITVMGHVDHGKTSLLDYIRKSNVIAGEAGGITQHIGAYNVVLSNGRRITFLDTPGHEAFTAMRARGAQLTDLAIIIIAADDAVMPQTVEAINHAQAAGVPMVFAINKIDKPGAQPEKIIQQLSQMNILVEDWGGKYQCQEISAKKGLNVDKLLEKVLLEADMLNLRANPKKLGVGAVIESSLDKGRGYLATVLVQDGTVRIGDVLLSGCYYGRVKAMFNERGQKVEAAGPATPVSILGLNGAPSAGDKFNVMADEKEAKAIANKREQLIRIQGIKTQKHMTLEEIGRRIAIGNFKELNIIVKGDVDGSVEALSDSIIKLSTEHVKVNVIHKAVGAISESDVLLAEASDAVIVGFQVRPSSEVRKLAEKDGIEIRLYSIIYDAINDVKEGIAGMLEPEKKEEVTATADVKQTFKISKVGTIAGCIVKDGKISKSSKVRLIRDGIVIYTGDLASLKRGKDDVKDVSAGIECGIGIENFNDIKEGDTIEAFQIVEVKAKA